MSDFGRYSIGSRGSHALSTRAGRIRTLHAGVVLAVLLVAAGLFLTPRRGDLAIGPWIDRNSLESVEARLDRPIEAGTEPTRREVDEAEDPQIAAPPESAVARIEVKGRLLMPDGSPAGGVPVILERSHASGSFSTADEEGESGRVIRSASTDDGRFSVSLPCARRLEFTLDVRPDSMCPLRWTWTNTLPREVNDLGDVTLEPAGTIIGHVLDHDGNPLSDRAWTIEVRHPWTDRRSRREPARPTCLSDPRTAAFEIHGVPPGKSILSANCLGTSRFAGPIVDVRPGETKYIDLVCPDEQVSSRITVVVSCPPFGRVPLRELSAVVLAGDQKSRTASARDESIDGITFGELGAGSYTVSIEDPKFLPWSRAGISPGQVVEARLAGSASVLLNVTDSGLNRSVDAYSIRAVLPQSSWLQGEFLVGEDAARTDGRVLVQGLLPIEQSFLISAPAYAETRTGDVVLTPGENRALNVELSKGVTITGRVVGGSRRAPAGEIEVFLAPYSLDAENAGRLSEVEKVRSAVSAAQSGRFMFSQVPSGKFLLQAARSAAHLSAIVLVDAAEGATPGDVELVLSDSARLEGRIVGPPGVTYAGLQLTAFPKGMPGTLDLAVRTWALQKQLDVPISASGQFEFGTLPAGEIVVALRLPDSEAPQGYSGASLHRGECLPLGSVVLAPGERTVHEFRLDREFPGAVDIFARVDGRSASDSIVTLYLVDPDGMHTMFLSALDGSPSVSLGPVPAGSYKALISALDGSWSWIMPDAVPVTRGDRIAVRPDIVLTRCSALVRRRSDGAPVVSGVIAVKLDSAAQVAAILAHPDENGRISLTMPPARYQFALRTDGTRRTERSPATLDWPLPGGADSAVLTLEDR